MQRELDELQSQLAEVRRNLQSHESVQADIDKLNVAHCKALKEQEAATSAVRAELEKATTQVADLEKALDAIKKSRADEIKALKEENARVKLELSDLTEYLRAAVRGLIGKFFGRWYFVPLRLVIVVTLVCLVQGMARTLSPSFLTPFLTASLSSATGWWKWAPPS